MTTSIAISILFIIGLAYSEGLISSYYHYRVAQSANCPQVEKCRDLRLTPPWQRLCRMVICKYHQNLPFIPSTMIRDERSSAPQHYQVITEDGDMTNDGTKRNKDRTGGGGAGAGGAGKRTVGDKKKESLLSFMMMHNAQYQNQVQDDKPKRSNIEPSEQRKGSFPDGVDAESAATLTSLFTADDDLIPDWSALNDVDGADWMSNGEDLGEQEEVQAEVSKRHWANPVVACVKSRCADATGENKLKCVIERCHKSLDKEKEE